MRTRLLVDPAPFDPAAEEAIFRGALGPDCGAIATFTGLMRNEDGSAERLTLEHFPGYTEQVIQTQIDAAMDRFSLLGVSIRHRTGVIGPAEAIVFVATAAAHRRAAFDACDYLMDHLKSAAPFWKKEAGPSGSRWIEPTDADIRARSAWEDDHAGN